MPDRIIRLTIQAGVILAVVIALPYKLFELDRYFVPKELVLHVAAAIIAIALFAARRALSFDRVDGLLAMFLLWSLGASLFAPWVAPHNPFDLATLNLLDGTTHDVWAVNTEAEYHEEGKIVDELLDVELVG